MQNALLAMHRHARWAWFGVIAYAATVTFPHENVQYVVNEIASFLTRQHLGMTGQAVLYKISAGVILFLGALLTWILYRRLKGQQERRTLAVFWILTIGLIWCTWRFGTANNVELVHYPQYVPEGMALLALTLSPVEALAWVALFGGLDECFQYWDLMGPKKVPYDFNDIYMDLLGGAAGVLLAMVFLRCDSRGESPSYWRRLLLRPGVVVILGIVVAGIALWAGGWMLLYDDGTNPNHWFALSRVRMPTFWFQVVANGPNKYHTLSPIEGPILILSTIALFAILDRRVRLSG
jgi:hypothetical protein